MLPKLRILFLCTGNSCHSQMAEGWARHLRGNRIEPYSAGIETRGLNPCVVRLAREAKTEEEALGQYRRIRDQIRAFVERLPGA